MFFFISLKKPHCALVCLFLQSASSVPPEEGTQQLNEKMEHLQLSGLSKETGVAAGSPNIQSSTEAETVNKRETGLINLSRLLKSERYHNFVPRAISAFKMAEAEMALGTRLNVG